ncbi:hypothetical protein D910_12576, partial [Dendroctonus ponderosae]
MIVYTLLTVFEFQIKIHSWVSVIYCLYLSIKIRFGVFFHHHQFFENTIWSINFVHFGHKANKILFILISFTFSYFYLHSEKIIFGLQNSSIYRVLVNILCLFHIINVAKIVGIRS